MASINNPYMHGQIWAQARAAGREQLSRLEPELQTRRFGRVLAAFTEVSSTNLIASSWASAGAPEGALVTADHQTSGRGRFGRVWVDKPGANLMFSIVLRPTLAPEASGLIMLAASVSVAEALASVERSLQVEIKWPNDVLVQGRKCCGMLMDASLSTAQRLGVPGVAVVGIGVNVNQDMFDEEHAHRATSLALECGRLIPRTPILASILNRFEMYYDGLDDDGGEAVREAYLSRLAWVEKDVVVYSATSSAPLQGRIRGISEGGALLLDTGSEMRSLATGEVSFRTP